MTERQLDCALDLMRRLPPQQIEKNLSDLIDLVPNLCEDLLSSVDQPLKIAKDKTTGKITSFAITIEMVIPTDHRGVIRMILRWTMVQCPLTGGSELRLPWDLDHGFAGVILIKKAGDGSRKIKGCWDSIHVVEVQEKSGGRQAHYKLTSTVMLWLQTNKTGSGIMNLGGSLTRQVETDNPVNDANPHICNIGRMVEDMENKMRNTLNDIYFGKTRDIVNALRSVNSLADKDKQSQIQKELFNVLKNRQK
ncbi:hypothetical protein OS493_006556 [Desmophyllum pertusum]|uniref:F-actin-capping protein subunit beta n=1 Tax=Desmophyllum pertusum TaxID=174260 RepID=A0A9X0A540_9CNID|nr:hypothetical protein OS493_006556 [Desmophyllum pertusum]